MRDKSKYASYSKSMSQSSHSSTPARGHGEHAGHGSTGKSSKRTGVESHERGGHGGGGGHATHSPVGIQEALGGAFYPAKKQTLVKTAQASDAVDSTLKTLHDIPDDECDTPATVSKVVNNEK